MGIKILSDRMIDLPKDELSSMGVDTISCYINMDGKSYSDLDDVFPEDVFNFMDETGRVAQTAAKSPALYAEFFRPYVEQGDTVIHFSASSGISAIAGNAKTAAEEYFPGKVFVIDTLLLSNGIALLVKYALRLIADGETDAEKVVSLVRAKIPKVQGSFLLDTLDCLYKGGRCSGLTYYAANYFKIKPVIHMDEKGRMVVREKLRGKRERVLEPYFQSTFTKYPDPELNQLYVVYTTYDIAVQDTIRNIVAKYHDFQNIQFNLVSCNCCVHSGRNTIGIFYMCK
ncbi:MAG: DegV family protein [Oscillospiraceae bacterium]|jgi:DegV family protein with EDD domain|nr:DegV family protein [Oscillospiraceae bacterium]